MNCSIEQLGKATGRLTHLIVSISSESFRLKDKRKAGLLAQVKIGNR